MVIWGCRTSSDSAPRGCGKKPRHDMASWRGEAFPWRVSLCLGVAPLQEPQLDSQSHCRSTAVGKRDGIKLRLGAQKRVVSATLRNHSRCHPRRARAQRRESRGKNLTRHSMGCRGRGEDKPLIEGGNVPRCGPRVPFRSPYRGLAVLLPLNGSTGFHVWQGHLRGDAPPLIAERLRGSWNDA
jgi:hypothetical protein